MTVAPRLQAEDLADVFEHLGSACTKLSQILKRQHVAGNSSGGRPKKSKTATAEGISEAVEATAAFVSEATSFVNDVFEPPVDAMDSVDAGTITADLTKLTKAVAKKGRPVRDPSAPKRPLTAFILFCMERRPSITANHPGLSFKEVATMMSKEWEQVDQKPYYDRAADLKKNYYEERASYMEGKASEQVEKAASPKVVVVSEPPATPQPAKTPKKRTPSVKRSRLEDLPAVVSVPVTPTIGVLPPAVAEPEMVLTQELIPETPVVVVEGEKKEKKRRKKVSDVASVASVVPVPPTVPTVPTVAPVEQVLVTPVSVVAPVAQPAIVAQTQPETQPEQPVATVQTGEPEKKKKKKKKTVSDHSDALSQASSAAAAPGLLSTQPLHIN